MALLRKVNFIDCLFAINNIKLKAYKERFTKWVNIMKDSNIEKYMETGKFENDKMLSFIFRGMCEAKEEQLERTLTFQELETFKTRLEQRIKNNKFSKNEYFNLVLAYRYTEYEGKTGKRLKVAERDFYAKELAKELGLEDSISKTGYLLVPNKDKIYPTDKRVLFGSSLTTRLKYKHLFEQMADGDRRTIRGFNQKMFSIPPKAKRQMALKAASAILIGILALEPIDVSVMAALNVSRAHLYSKQIEDYESRMDKYADELRKMNLSPIQLVIKITDDMHANISGYDIPKIDATGFWRLDVSDSSGTGVCRNMADNITYIMNKVDPMYNARNMFVRLNAERIDMADIDRKINYNHLEEIEAPSQSAPNFVANHMITVFDLPDKEYSLVIDPTNPAIGILADGKIIMLNNVDGSIDYTPLSELPFGIDYQIGIVKNLKSMSSHSTLTDIDLDAMKEEWGKEAQNKALEEVRAMPNAIKMAQVAYTSAQEIIETQEKSDSTITNIKNDVEINE